MNLRDLQYLVAVAETGHFGRAAERCFVSQPTLSAQIKKLEERLGVVVFERSNRSVAVTPIGEQILHHARQVLEQAAAIEELARAQRDPLSGPLRIGAIHTISPYLIPLILAPLRKAYPQLTPVLTEEMTKVLLQRLHEHAIDVALLATEESQPDLEEWVLFDEPFWLAHPHDHPIYTQDEIGADDLSRLDMLLLSEGHCLSEQVLDVCNMKERPQSGAMGDLRAASLETLLQLVGAGYGCTLVPALALRSGWMTGSGVIVRKLDLPGASRRVRLVFRKTFPRRRAIEALAEVIRGQLPNTVKVVDCY
jgi:LysR family hydrogen peroxide-inducible transcriptional activator